MKPGFQDYLLSQPGYANGEKTYNNYLGIYKKEFPKWEGWSIIQMYKTEGVEAKDIQDELLKCLVENHYYVFYLKECIIS